MGSSARGIIFAIAISVASAACSGSDEKDDESEDEEGSFGLSAMIRNPDSTAGGGRQCPTSTGVEWDVGRPAPSSSNPGQPISGATCRVRSNGEFDVAASGTDPQITSGGNITIDFAGSTSGEMQAAISTSQTGTIVTETQACTVSVISPQDPGSLWISYVCPLLTTNGSAAVGCHAQGQLVLAGCGR